MAERALDSRRHRVNCVFRRESQEFQQMLGVVATQLPGTPGERDRMRTVGGGILLRIGANMKLRGIEASIGGFFGGVLRPLEARDAPCVVLRDIGEFFERAAELLSRRALVVLTVQAIAAADVLE